MKPYKRLSFGYFLIMMLVLKLVIALIFDKALFEIETIIKDVISTTVIAFIIFKIFNFLNPNIEVKSKENIEM